MYIFQMCLNNIILKYALNKTQENLLVIIYKYDYRLSKVGNKVGNQISIVILDLLFLR